MPNLLPDWMAWIQPAGRLIWGVVLTFAALAFVVVLLRPPLLKRPFSNRVAFAFFPAVLLVGYVIAIVIPDKANISGWEIDALIVDIVLVALWAHALLLVASRNPRDPERTTTWAEAYLGATATFAILALAYAVVPHEWLTFANGYLQWGDRSKFIFQSNQDMLFFPWHWPFNFDLPAVRDIVVTVIYVVFLGLNLKMFVMWQQRKLVPETPSDIVEAAPARTSRFGRPLRRWSAEAAESAPAGTGA